jgi:hypothetical protein
VRCRRNRSAQHLLAGRGASGAQLEVVPEPPDALDRVVNRAIEAKQQTLDVNE